MYYFIPIFSISYGITCLGVLHKSTTTNLGNITVINMLLNDVNDMDDDVISYRNNFVSNPVSVNFSIRVESEY